MRPDIKIVLLGSSGVGKTSIFVRYFDNSWNRQIHRATIGQGVNFIEHSHEGETYKIAVWDTAGSERYSSLTPMFYRDADYCILCFDPSNTDTWTKVRHWYADLRNTNSSCKVALCATKKDLIDSDEKSFLVTNSELRNYTAEINASYHHVSSKTGENIDMLFEYVLQKCFDDHELLQTIKEKRRRTANETQEANARENVRKEHNSCC